MRDVVKWARGGIFWARVDGLEGCATMGKCQYHSYLRVKKWADEFDESVVWYFFIDKGRCVVIMYRQATEERTRHWTAKDIIKRL